MYHFWISSSDLGGGTEVGDHNSALFQWIVPFCNIHSPKPNLSFHSPSLWKACEFPCSSSITKHCLGWRLVRREFYICEWDQTVAQFGTRRYVGVSRTTQHYKSEHHVCHIIRDGYKNEGILFGLLWSLEGFLIPFGWAIAFTDWKKLLIVRCV